MQDTGQESTRPGKRTIENNHNSVKREKSSNDLKDVLSASEEEKARYISFDYSLIFL